MARDIFQRVDALLFAVFRIAFAEKGLRPWFVEDALIFEITVDRTQALYRLLVAGAAMGPAGEDFRELSNVVLRVTAIDAQCGAIRGFRARDFH